MLATSSSRSHRLAKLRFRFSLRTLLFVVSLPCITWGLTKICGVWDVTDHFAAQMRDRVPGAQQLVFVKQRSEMAVASCTPDVWFSVGNASAPYPFVVALDFELRSGYDYGFGRVCYVWVFGLKWQLGHRLQESSVRDEQDALAQQPRP